MVVLVILLIVLSIFQVFADRKGSLFLWSKGSFIWNVFLRTLTKSILVFPSSKTIYSWEVLESYLRPLVSLQLNMVFLYKVYFFLTFFMFNLLKFLIDFVLTKNFFYLSFLSSCWIWVVALAVTVFILSIQKGFTNSKGFELMTDSIFLLI